MSKKAGSPSLELRALELLNESAELRSEGEETAIRHIKFLIAAYEDGMMSPSETFLKMADFTHRVVEARAK